MRNSRVRTVAEIGLSVALFAVLQFVAIKLPINIAGGSISLAMAMIVILSLLRGPVVGIVCGILCGFVDLMLQPYIVSAVQVVIDYPVAYGLVGVSGFLSPLVLSLHAKSRSAMMSFAIICATFAGGLARLLAHVLSGVLFFAANAPKGQSVWIYSLVYNLSYMVPTVIAIVVVCLLAVPVLVTMNQDSN